MRSRLSIQRWWYLGYGLLWGTQFGLYSSQSFFGSIGFVRYPNDAFNLASLITVIICSLIIGLLWWRKPSLPPFMPVAVPTVLYLMSILMLAIPNSPVPLTALMIGAGIISGASFSVLLTNWFKLFALDSSTNSLRRIASSSLLGTTLCLLITYAPFSVVMPLVVAILALAAWLQFGALHTARERRADNPEAAGSVTQGSTDAPRQGSTGFAAPKRSQRPRQVAAALAGPLMCRCVLGFAFAIISQVAFVSPAGFVGSNNLFNLGMFSAAFLFFIIAAISTRGPAPTTLFRVLFPLLGAALLLLPFLDPSLWPILGMFVTTAAHLVQIAFVFLVADLVRRSNAESNIVAPLTHALDQLAILLGIILGITIIGDNLNTVRLMLITGATVYLLMMAMFFFVRWNRNRSIIREWSVASPAASADEAEASARGEDNAFLHREDDLDARVELLARLHALTPREREILGYLCRGRSTPYICEELTLSKNTVHSHIKRMYLKLEIHGKQELLNLVEAVCPVRGT